MSREGRSQPIQPVALHGFLGNTPANGVLPGRVVVVENDDRRRKTPPLPATIINGAYALAVAPVVNPPAPTVAAAPDRPRASTAPLPVVEHGFLDSGVGVPGTAPPAPTSIDRADQRVRYKPLDATVISGALNATTPPVTVAPPAPVVVTPEQRRRTPELPIVITGEAAADVAPPEPVNLDRVDQRARYLPLDAIAFSAAKISVTQPDITPPGPYVVPLDERRRFLAALPATAAHGFVDPGPAPVGTTPPPILNLDRVDQRARYLPLAPLIYASGLRAATVPPPPPPVVQAGTDWAANIFSS